MNETVAAEMKEAEEQLDALLEKLVREPILKKSIAIDERIGALKDEFGTQLFGINKQGRKNQESAQEAADELADKLDKVSQAADDIRYELKNSALASRGSVDQLRRDVEQASKALVELGEQQTVAWQRCIAAVSLVKGYIKAVFIAHGEQVQQAQVAITQQTQTLERIASLEAANATIALESRRRATWMFALLALALVANLVMGCIGMLR